MFYTINFYLAFKLFEYYFIAKGSFILYEFFIQATIIVLCGVFAVLETVGIYLLYEYYLADIKSK